MFNLRSEEISEFFFLFLFFFHSFVCLRITGWLGFYIVEMKRHGRLDDAEWESTVGILFTCWRRSRTKGTRGELESVRKKVGSVALIRQIVIF